MVVGWGAIGWMSVGGWSRTVPGASCIGPCNLILVNSQGFAFWRCFGALYFEGLKGLILITFRTLCSGGALELNISKALGAASSGLHRGLRSGGALELYISKALMLISREFMGICVLAALCSFIFRRPEGPNPHEFTGVCVLQALCSFIFRKP